MLDDGSSDDTVRIIKAESSVLLFMKNNPGGGGMKSVIGRSC